MMRYLLLVALALPAAPVQAQTLRTFALPAGCTAYLTVQQASCGVSHHFTCDADPAGLQRRVDMDENGVAYFGAIDAETQWIESFHTYSGHTETLSPNPAKPASFTALIETGASVYDFQTNSPEIGTTRYVGTDTLTGETVVIDGVTLERTEYNITAYDTGGGEMWSSQGNEYISRDWRMFLAGQSTISADGESWESDDRPVEFIFPDEPGFLSVSPKHGCGAVMSALPIANPMSEQAHDAI